jgi:hypothetical protein
MNESWIVKEPETNKITKETGDAVEICAKST